MRNRNVFGKKLSRANIVFLIAGVFGVLFLIRVLVLNNMTGRLNRLETERIEIQREINRILNNQSNSDIARIDEIINYLPNTFSQDLTNVAMSRILSASNLVINDGFSINYNLNVTTTPINKPLPSTVKAVGITIRVTADNPAYFIDFIENLLAEDVFYFVGNVSISYYDTNSLMTITFFTYYNNVQV